MARHDLLRYGLYQFISDNQATVMALSSRSAHDTDLMHLLRCLFFFEAHFKFEHKSIHIPGKVNVAKDALSRDKLDMFFSIFLQANRTPDQCQHFYYLYSYIQQSTGHLVTGMTYSGCTLFKVCQSPP